MRADEYTLLEAVEKYNGWLYCRTRPEHAAEMKLYWAYIIHRKAVEILSAAQDTYERMKNGKDSQSHERSSSQN